MSKHHRFASMHNRNRVSFVHVCVRQWPMTIIADGISINRITNSFALVYLTDIFLRRQKKIVLSKNKKMKLALLFTCSLLAFGVEAHDDEVLQRQLEAVKRKIAQLEQHIPALEEKIANLEDTVTKNDVVIDELENRRQLQDATCVFAMSTDAMGGMVCTLASPLLVDADTTIMGSATFGNATEEDAVAIARAGGNRRLTKSSSKTTTTTTTTTSSDGGQRNVNLGNPYATVFSTEGNFSLTAQTLTVDAHTAVAGNATLEDDIDVGGQAWANFLVVNGDLDVAGDTIIDGFVNITDELTCEGDAVVETNFELVGLSFFEDNFEIDDPDNDHEMNVESNVILEGGRGIIFNQDVVINDEVDVTNLNIANTLGEPDINCPEGFGTNCFTLAP